MLDEALARLRHLRSDWLITLVLNQRGHAALAEGDHRTCCQLLYREHYRGAGRSAARTITCRHASGWPRSRRSPGQASGGTSVRRVAKAEAVLKA